MVADGENVDPVVKKIIRQVEYYFGDFNLPRDKFLQEETKSDDGWVTMETMLKFKRLSELSKDEKVIVAALKQSKAGLLEVSEDGSKIRRDPAIPLPENTEESRKLLEARTAYAKGFNKETTTLDELLDYYNEANPDVVSIQMRNYCEKKGKEKVWKFKGSIFLTFKTEDAAKAFVAKEEKYKEETLLKKFQKDYLEEKKKEMEEKKNKYQKKDKKPKTEGADGKEEAEEKQEEEFKLPKGSVLKLTGLGGEITREDIKEVLKDECSVNIDKDGGDIAFITYEKGEAEAKLCAISIEGVWWCTSSQVVELLGCWRGRDILSLMVRMKEVPVQELRLCASSLLSLFKKCEADAAILTEVRKGAKYLILYRLRELPLLFNAFSKDRTKFDQLLMEVTRWLKL